MKITYHTKYQQGVASLPVPRLQKTKQTSRNQRLRDTHMATREILDLYRFGVSDILETLRQQAQQRDKYKEKTWCQ